MKKRALLSIAVGLLLAGCASPIKPLTSASQTIEQTVNAEQQKQADKTQALVKCQQLCQDTLSSDGVDFEVGPCLSNEIAPDWVCDVVHEPRQAVDNLTANQCEAFRQGRANHFVEVDGNCNVVQAR